MTKDNHKLYILNKAPQKFSHISLDHIPNSSGIATYPKEFKGKKGKRKKRKEEVKTASTHLKR